MEIDLRFLLITHILSVFKSDAKKATNLRLAMSLKLVAFAFSFCLIINGIEIKFLFNSAIIVDTSP